MRTRRKPHCRLLAAILAAGLLAGCSLPALEWMPRLPDASPAPAEDAPAAPAPGIPAGPLVVLVDEDAGSENGFSALLAAYAESQGASAELLSPGADAANAGLVLLARRPEPSGWVDLAAEPLLGVLARGAAALPGFGMQNGCPALPLGFAGYGYLADGTLLKALLGDGFDPALLAGADWAEWKAFVETLGSWINAPAEETVTLAGRSFTLPAEKPDAAQNLAGVFAPPAGPPGYAGSALSPALAAAGAEEDAGQQAGLLTGPLNGVWAGFQLEQAWAAASSGSTSAAPGEANDVGTGENAPGGEAPDSSAGAQTPPADAAALLEGGRAVFCRAMTGGLNGCSAEFRSRLVLLPFKAAFDETDLAPGAAVSLEALNGWLVLGTPGWLAVPAGASPEQRALAEGFLLWLFASAEGQRALEDTMGALSIAGAGEPQSPALQAVADALHTGQALPDLAADLSPQAHARASEAFANAARNGSTGSAARSEWVNAVLEALAGTE